MDEDASLVTTVSVIKAIGRGCKAELDAGRSLISMEDEYPGALIETAPDMQRFIVEMEGKQGARTFKRLREIASAVIDWDEEPNPYEHNTITKR